MNDVLLAAALALLLTWILGRFLSRPNAETASRMVRVSGREARELRARGVPFVAVFSAAEFSQAHIPGSVNIPVQELADRIDELAAADEVLVYCASGMRSARAARLLAEAGKKVYDLGGMGAY